MVDSFEQRLAKGKDKQTVKNSWDDMHGEDEADAEEWDVGAYNDEDEEEEEPASRDDGWDVAVS
eukprot:4415206-Karenia_brevis.AAC.1